jgi:uncharacterized iron-regulated membrane protein
MLRKTLFWLHLIAGCAGGLIILTMSATGVLLMYERQILAKVERGPFRSAPAGERRLGMEELLSRVIDLPANATVTVRSDASEPVEVAAGRESTFYVSPYTGAVLGRPSGKWRAFFQDVTSWHRWLGAKGEGRTTAKAITGACNLAFLLLIVSGPFLWLPKQWTRKHVSPIVWFRRGLAGKARDFNWHNAIGIWCAIPLFFVVLSAAPMSYQWANALLYRMTGSEAPAAGGRGPGGERGERSRGTVTVAGLDRLWARAAAQEPAWRSISLRLPEGPRRPAVFTIDTGDGGQPQRRSTLTLNRATGEVERHETFADQNAGRRLRSWSRFVHTGEAYGMAGQTVAGIASAGAVVLVWTGIALSLRRFAAWRRRRAREEGRVETGVLV